MPASHGGRADARTLPAAGGNRRVARKHKLAHQRASTRSLIAQHASNERGKWVVPEFVALAYGAASISCDHARRRAAGASSGRVASRRRHANPARNVVHAGAGNSATFLIERVRARGDSQLRRLHCEDLHAEPRREAHSGSLQRGHWASARRTSRLDRTQMRDRRASQRLRLMGFDRTASSASRRVELQTPTTGEWERSAIEPEANYDRTACDSRPSDACRILHPRNRGRPPPVSDVVREVKSRRGANLSFTGSITQRRKGAKAGM